jgi:hypothetical protein
MSDNGVYQQLAERFPAEDHKTRKQGGRDLTYRPGEKVIGRLNKVLGFDWSFRVVNQGATDVEAWVLGELSVTIDGSVVTRQQYGNQDLARGQHATTDLYKSAATDALKKAATTIGIGLYLYDEDERREVEAEMREASRPKPAPRPAPPTPIRDAAVLTGAAPIADPVIYQCLECNKDVEAGSTLNIQKNDKKQRVNVAVEEFYPVCEARLGGFHCAACYDKKFWGAA